MVADNSPVSVEISFLETVQNRLPDHIPLLVALGDLYTQVGRIREGYECDERLIQLCPEDDSVWYNHACSCALMNLPDTALASLQRALQLGYDDLDHLLGDEDLACLRSLPAFQEIVRQLRE
jgi:tetratricopeptide (TPR) repeat protein